MKKHRKNLGEQYADAVAASTRAERKLLTQVKKWIRARAAVQRLQRRLDAMQTKIGP